MSEKAFRTLDDIDVKGRRVIVRLDLNVPMKDGKITDTLRIERQAPTVRELADKGARVIATGFERLRCPFWEATRQFSDARCGQLRRDPGRRQGVC